MTARTFLFLLVGAASLAACHKQPPAHQSAADHYREHPEVSNPRGGFFTHAKPGTYGFETPHDTSVNTASAPAK